MQIKAGDKLKDNDPRMVGRELVVLEVGDTRVQCQHAKYPSFPKVWIRIDRIHTDGKPRRSGFDLVTPNAIVSREREAGTTERGD